MCIKIDDPQIQFSDSKSKIDFQQLLSLFKIGAFWAQERTKEDLETAIANSEPAISVWDRERLIGFARATSDEVYRATIWDVVIHPEYRGIGLGGKLVETVLSHPRISKVERVYLMTTHQQKFYEHIGFEENQTTTMVLHNSCSTKVITNPDLQLQKKHKELNTVAV